MTATNPSIDWEKEFDEKFSVECKSRLGMTLCAMPAPNPDSVKQFIRDLFAAKTGTKELRHQINEFHLASLILADSNAPFEEVEKAKDIFASQIQSLLSRKEEEVRKEVVEFIESRRNSKPVGLYTRTWLAGYARALEEVLEAATHPKQ